MGRPARLLLAALYIGTMVSAARAADVSLMVGGIEKQIYLPVVLAQQLGYFQG
jgi:NitT/TauT family transport system substrate-binding protein